jgi:hypothetical protein
VRTRLIYLFILAYTTIDKEVYLLKLQIKAKEEQGNENNAVKERVREIKKNRK